jgi:parvulin-like peptidyl-prolyl isomerase
VRDPEFRKEVRDRLRIKRYREEHLLADLTLEEGELRAWYETHTADYTEPARYLVRQIFLDKERAIQRAWESLEDGEAFESVAAELNLSAMRERPQLVRVADLPPVLAEALAGLEPGQHTEPVQSAEGFHILRLEGMRGGGPREFEEVRERVEMDLLRAKSADRIEETIEEMAGQEPFLFMPENLDFPYVP